MQFTVCFTEPKPTEKMRSFTEKIANELGLALPPDTYDAHSAFISIHKQEVISIWRQKNREFLYRVLLELNSEEEYWINDDD